VNFDSFCSQKICKQRLQTASTSEGLPWTCTGASPLDSMNGRTYTRMPARTDGQPEKMMPLPPMMGRYSTLPRVFNAAQLTKTQANAFSVIRWVWLLKRWH